MGMYTELYVSCRFRANLTTEEIDTLAYMFNFGHYPHPKKLPDHLLFGTPRWEQIGNTGSHYFQPFATTSFKYDATSQNYFLTSRSDFKNYDEEVELFFDWIQSMVDEPVGQFIGYSRYEEDLTPTIYIKR
jgi:hypothetical protein